MPDYRPFAAKAEAYCRYRIAYPGELIDYALAKARLRRTDSVADLGSGTGFWSRAWLGRAAQVFAVEPDPDMRAEAERTFGSAAGFQSSPGTAEATGLDAHSIDVVTAGNAFHYFDPLRVRAEVTRIAKPGARVVLVEHRLPATLSPFMIAYLAFLERHTPPHLRSAHAKEQHESRMARFFQDRASFEESVLERSHPLSREALEGRFLSTSIAPLPGDSGYASILEELHALHAREATTAGTVDLDLRWVCTWCDWNG